MDVTKLPPQSDSGDSNGPTPIKAARMHDPHDPNISDHVVAVTSLKEKIANLQKQISQKDGQLIAKEKQVNYFYYCFLNAIFYKRMNFIIIIFRS